MHHAHIDKFAYQDSPIHRLDSRVKFITAVVFTVTVLSLPRTSFAILACFAVGPFAILVAGKIPLRFVFKHILAVSPFVAVLALSCPFYDRTLVDAAFGPFLWKTSLGWVRCFVIVGKFIVAMMTLIALISTTRVSDLLVGLRKFGLPKILIIQIGFLYRYIFILIDRAHHILRARAARKLRNLGFSSELKTSAAMLGSLLIRSIDSAERTSIAMQARGFDGNWRSISKLRIRFANYLFAFGAALFMLLLYFFVRPVLM